MGYEDGFYSQGQQRGRNDDPAARIAQEIFRHDLRGAAYETQQLLRGASAQEAERFVNRVNRNIDNLSLNYGSDDDGCANHLSVSRGIDRRTGRQVERISMVSDDGYHKKGIIDLQCSPYDRVQPNFRQYTDGEQPGQRYYSSDSRYSDPRYSDPRYSDPRYSDRYQDPDSRYDQNGRPIPSSRYDYDYQQQQQIAWRQQQQRQWQQQQWQEQQWQEQQYGGFYHRPYYGGGNQYAYGYGQNRNLAAGLLIGAVASRIFRL